MKILLVQNSPEIGNKKANFNKIEQLALPYLEKKPDLIILPELFAVGWDCEILNQYKENPQNSETTEFLVNLAKRFNSNLIGGSFVIEDEEKLKNRCLFISRDGEIKSHYDKMHLFSYYDDNEGKYISNGKNGIIVDCEGIKIGLSICYDIRFGTLYSKYADKGAELLVNVAAWPLNRSVHWDTLSRARAIENQAFMIAVSQSGIIKPKKINYGHSKIINPLGNIICEADEKESAIFAEIDISEVSKLRKQVPTLKDRHIKYDIIEV